MAAQTLTPQTSVSPSLANSEHEVNLTLEQQLMSLQKKFVALEQKFLHLNENQTTAAENASGKVTDVSEDSPTASAPTGQSPPEEKKTEPASRAKILINKINPDTGERKDEQTSDEVADTKKSQNASHAFTLRKIVENDGQDNSGELEIVSRDLWNLLKELLKDYPYHLFQGDPVTILSPYEALILKWDKLQTAAKESLVDEKEKQARMDLQLLLDTISTGSGDPKLDKYFKTRDSNREQKSVTFESLWTLFPPGALVYGRLFQGQDQIFIVLDNYRPWPRNESEPPPWTLQCLTYDWDGMTFKRRAVDLKIPNFENAKPITSLDFFPLDYYPDLDDLKRRLLDRGAKYKQFCTAKQGSQMFDYKGDVGFGKKGFSRITGDEDEDDEWKGSSFDRQSEYSGRNSQDSKGVANKSTNVDGRVMVDFDSYFRYGPAKPRLGSEVLSVDSTECQCLECQKVPAWNTVYRNRFDKEEHQENWEEEQYMLCPPRVLGYILHEKQWVQLQVTGLREIPKEHLDQSWDRVKLVDGEETKKMILNLVKGHGTGDSKDDESSLVVDDIVAKKGKGLVILLYGPPGVGKTSTAETVAIAARKPLFSISVADVGTEAKNVEANLSKIFALAASWQAILLIDEADVFLESRGRGAASNTERNALVSVFLRVLEYYQGILMLTTNQIAHFDVAVQSRIHIAIKYSKLSDKQTMSIFEGFLKPLEEKNSVKDIADIREWIEEDVYKAGLDGRQIRNIVTSALGLARAERRTKLEKKDLKKVWNNVREFKTDFMVQFEKYKNSQEGMVG